MTNDITTIVFAKTFHVLGAVTRSSGPRTTETPQDLVGADGLVLRVPFKPEVQIVIDVSQLAIQNVAANNGLMMSPMNFQLTGDPQKPPMIPSDGTSYAIPQTALAFVGNNVKVTLPAVPAVNLDLYVQVGKTLIPMTIPAGQTSATKPLQVSTGDNAFLLLVPGYQALVGFVTA